TEHRPGRFTTHDLIRVYAAELSEAVDTGDDRHEALGRLLDHYLHSAYSAHLLLKPHFAPPAPAAARPDVTLAEISGYGPAMTWFAAERHALKAAVATAAEAGFPAHAWQLALTLQQFYQRQGYWHDWLATTSTALGAALAAGDLAAQ